MTCVTGVPAVCTAGGVQEEGGVPREWCTQGYSTPCITVHLDIVHPALPYTWIYRGSRAIYPWIYRGSRAIYPEITVILPRNTLELPLFSLEIPWNITGSRAIYPGISLVLELFTLE